MYMCLVVIYSADTQWVYQWLLFDEDGSLTGGAPATKVLAYSPIYNPAYCRNSTEWGGRYPAMICDPEAKFGHFGYTRFVPYESLFLQDIYLENEFGGHIRHFSGSTGFIVKGWYAILPTGVLNKISYPDFPGITDIYYNFKLVEMDVSINKYVNLAVATMTTLYIVIINHSLP